LFIISFHNPIKTYGFSRTSFSFGKKKFANLILGNEIQKI